MSKGIIPALETSDGAGVKIFRSLGHTQEVRLDPFLMLDEFCSENPNDYIGGFPSHPHRGFETFTYMIEGHLKHEDSMGNSGELKSGEIQWMTAGRGIVHSEMPLQKDGLMKGFQLWVNLPSSEKMQPPRYKDIKASEIISIEEGSTRIKLIAGNYKEYQGPIQGLTTELDYFDVSISEDAFSFIGDEKKNYFLYPFEGKIEVNDETLSSRNGICFSGSVKITTKHQSRFLLIGGKPLFEPIFQYGPFVMNTKNEILQAIEDFQSGSFGK